jgi:hypothetical protein
MSTSHSSVRVALAQRVQSGAAWWLHHHTSVLAPATSNWEDVMAKMMRTSSSRRTLLQSLGVGVAATAATGLAPDAEAHASLRAEPTMKGRQLLRVIGMTRRAWRDAPDQLSDPEGFEAFESYVGNVLFETAKHVAAEMCASPVRTLSAIVDRAIVLAWTQTGEDASWFDQHIDGGLDKMLAPLLAIGGITLAECDEDASSPAA